MMLRLFVTACLLATWTACTECKGVGHSWCEGTRVIGCEISAPGNRALPGPGYYRTEQKADCADRGLACFEDGNTAQCAIADQQCDPGRPPVCMGAQIVSCHASGHPQHSLLCTEGDPETGAFCFELDGGAVCSPSSARCEGDFSRCFAGTRAICRDGIWRADGTCESSADAGSTTHAQP